MSIPASDERAAWAGLGVVFATTILVSAFLLFQVQPLISKYILPWFGGSPAVWTTCMLFFQVTLFAGYTYAHLLNRFLSNRAQAIVHMGLIAVAILLMLPTIAPAASWKPLDSSHPTGRILLLLAATVGLPYFVLSTTGPLVQAWFARTWPGRSPYRLYALSNVGSLAALLTYPFVFEPAFRSDTQAGLWTMAFGVFAILCAMSALWIFKLPGRGTAASDAVLADEEQANRALVQSPTLTRRLLWIGLPACASLVLLATTNYVCQDVAVIPFLWVVPLALYLLTFIIAFDRPSWFRPVPMSMAAIILAVLSAGAGYDLLHAMQIHVNYLHELTLDFSAMFMAAMVCHGQLFRLRPAPRWLTEYYLLISFGGALGGIFVSLVAPVIFKTHFEWTLALACALVVATAVLLRHAHSWRLSIAQTTGERATGAAIVCAAAYFFVPGAFSSVYWLTDGATSSDEVVYRARNFYGTVSVWELGNDPAMRYRSFVSGSTPHGRQFVDPAKRHIPISYFGPHTGIGRTLTYFQSRPDARVGIVGMGVGVVAAYAKPGHYFRFYEINEEVEKIARNEFTYLKDCEGRFDVVLADARLALEREMTEGHAQRFNVLALDAFSGDAPPVHLLTDEAFAIYMQHLEPDGVIVVNITNRYLDLAPVINAAAKKYGLDVTRVVTDIEPEKLLYHTDFMMLSRNKDFLAANPPVLIPEYVQPDREVPLWTDKFSDLFTILKR